MKYTLHITIAVLVVGAFIYFMVFKNEQPQLTRDEGTGRSVATAQINWETKTDDKSPVTIRVTPIEFGKEIEMWKFQIVFDTHSGSLDDDLLTVVSLTDDEGNVYQPVALEGQGPGGHHRESTLIFNRIDPIPKYIELRIKNVGGVVERSFQWEIK